MNDKERILMSMVRRAYSLYLRCVNNRIKPCEYDLSFDFESKPREGDLVFAQTSQPNDFMIGYYVCSHGNYSSIIREIGTNRECKYGNENFVPIHGLHEPDLLDREKRKIYEKVRKADTKIYNKYYRYIDNIKVTDTNVSFSVILPATQEKLFNCDFKYNSRTTIKSIVKRVTERLE